MTPAIVVDPISVDFSTFSINQSDNVEVYQVKCPEHILSWIESLGLKANICELFVTPPGTNIGAPLHIDGSTYPLSVPKFNWVHKGGEMIWMEPTKRVRPIELATNHGTTYLRFMPKSCKEIFRTELKNEATLVEAGIPHYIDYTGDEYRYCLSITLKLQDRSPSFNEVLGLAVKP